ncbi:hypothetical protein [Streptomyces sp. NPDC057494]|uniref:hypothetical protein n=1 Tax=Streptomyces sp. NPDC057494 TaxID=3346148 RepID=UPI0036B59F59
MRAAEARDTLDPVPGRLGTGGCRQLDVDRPPVRVHARDGGERNTDLFARVPQQQPVRVGTEFGEYPTGIRSAL